MKLTLEDRRDLVDYYEVLVHGVDMATETDAELKWFLKFYNTYYEINKTDFYLFRLMNVLNELGFRGLL